MKKKAVPRLPREELENLPPIVRDYIVSLEEYLEWLETKVNRNSRNTSLPPSSDLNPPPRKKRKKQGRSIGGQPGHPGNSRPLEKPDRVIPHFPKICDGCGSVFHGTEEEVGDRVVFQHREFVAKPTEVVQDEFCRCRCGNCQKPVLADIPPEARECLGPRLKALGVYLNGECHVSLKKISRLFRDGFQVSVSTATLAKTRVQASEGLQFATKEVYEEVREAPFKNVDETKWSQSGVRSVLWGIATERSSFFGILPTRATIAAKSLLGDDPKGIVTTDRSGSYNFLVPEQHAFCWSHLDRNFQRFSESPEPQKTFGERGMSIADAIFHVWHLFLAGMLSNWEFDEKILTIRQRLGKLLWWGMNSGHPEIIRFSRELASRWESLFVFAKYRIDPTNNAAERALRPGVMWRKICMGTRSDEGDIFVGRILTVAETCKKQQRSLISVLNKVFECRNHGIINPPVSIMSKIQ